MAAPDDARTDVVDRRRHLAWETALDRLELDVMLTERLLDRADGEPGRLPQLHPWEPPTGLGLMPERLLERARLVLARQAELQQLRRGGRCRSARERRSAPRRPGQRLPAALDAGLPRPAGLRHSWA